jgi:NAD(P)-dependent dehydrogenase (short-subunit alcohol dehydrogenase family)
VVISGRQRETIDQAAAEIRAARSSNTKVLPSVCHVSDAQAVEQMFAEVAKEFGGLDILINNAGIAQSAAPVEETSIKLWREIIDINLTGTFLCTRFAIPLMRRGGTILNVLSVAASECFEGYAAYNASKAGVMGLTRTLRQELMPKGIRVTALFPGATDTEMWQQMMPDAPRNRMMDAATVASLVLEAVVLSPKANLTELVLDPVEGAL